MKINKQNIIKNLILFLFIIWLSISYYLYINHYRIENISMILWENKIIILIFFLLLFAFRIFLFIPSTLLIIWLWILINDFLLTFCISFFWVFIWLIETYYIWTLINWDLNNNHIYKKIKPFISKFNDNWFKITLIWCFLPFLPTDIICYTAWFVRYNIKKFLLAWMLWELSLVFAYSYFWANITYLINKINNYIFIILIFLLLFYFILKKYIKNKK